MGLWSWLAGGGTKAVAGAAETIGGIFKPNAERSQERIHEKELATLEAYSREFHERQNRNVIDSIADGLNRLPRPLIALSVCGLFALSYLDTQRFVDVMAAWSIAPPGLLALLGGIIGFYFHIRENKKSRDFQMTEKQAEMAKALIEARSPPPAPAPPSPPVSASPVRNRVVREWRRRQAAQASP